MEKTKVVISDCHLSAGRYVEGKLNLHEDFFYDTEMVEFIRFFSSGEYGEKNGQPVDVELIINGDFFDFLNVTVEGEFEDAITEDISVDKIRRMIAGHPKVMNALRAFASKPNKKITYIIGNHDADLFFPRVREMIIKTWDPNGEFPSEKVRIIHETDHIRLEGGVEIHHGNQFEAVNVLNFKAPVLTEHLDEPVLNLPWGSFYVLKVMNRLKYEREYIDKVRPVKLFILYGLFTDFWFTVRFCFLTSLYFMKTRFVYSPKRKSRLKVTMNILQQESKSVFQDLVEQARQYLDENEDVKTIIFGHTHSPMDRIWPDGKQYINTGTWTRMVHLDLRGLGQEFRKTFAHIRIVDGKAECELRYWEGEYHPHRVFNR